MSEINLYELPITGARARRLCGGNLTGDNESCVQVAEIPGAPDTFVLTDSKPEGAGKELRFTRAEIDAFVQGWNELRNTAS